MFDPVLNERRQDFATDEEVVAYWLGYCKDALSRAAEIRRAKRGLQMKIEDTIHCDECGQERKDCGPMRSLDDGVHYVGLRHLPRLGQDRRIHRGN